ncbi:hypothetical protein L226DRAFT_89559 [Lentinus tigrinus ALCF2SS1-7]|uniref:Uncharacterized protein n=1 Tax=Lentinus tigrinus ALCF2SS1-6 TaxID=1328759 RepID=A0A5C2RWC9_9APHY|nr:hypothetical protein L227DRAFT_343138 [Lentinus tigrinus ALCF2SS1-6]RPD73862.1 hypothetical protein L226DRAFT_89559 [Lentinus tigrinus ALCF2SS1-7]
MSGRAVRAIEKSLWVTCNVGRRIAARNTREGTRQDPTLLREQIARITPPPVSPLPLIVVPSPGRCIRTLTLFINPIRPFFSVPDGHTRPLLGVFEGLPAACLSNLHEPQPEATTREHALGRISCFPSSIAGSRRNTQPGMTACITQAPDVQRVVCVTTCSAQSRLPHGTESEL